VAVCANWWHDLMQIVEVCGRQLVANDTNCGKTFNSKPLIWVEFDANCRSLWQLVANLMHFRDILSSRRVQPAKIGDCFGFSLDQGHLELEQTGPKF
jgi:hypothetical protein